MAKLPDFLIEIGRYTKVLGIDELQTEVLGAVPNIPGTYPVDGMDVQICPTSKPKHSSILQKVIVREVRNQRRRVALVHHNASKSVVLDLDRIQSLTFAVRREELRDG